MTRTKQPMPPAQALTLAALVLDFEADNAAQVSNRQWWSECKEAAQVVRRLRDTGTAQRMVTKNARV